MWQFTELQVAVNDFQSRYYWNQHEGYWVAKVANEHHDLYLGEGSASTVDDSKASLFPACVEDDQKVAKDLQKQQ